MKLIKTYIFVSLAFLFLSCNESILGPNEGSVNGLILDNNGKPVSDASLRFRYLPVVDSLSEDSISYTLKSNQDGEFQQSNMLLLNYELFVIKKGLRPIETDVALTQGLRNLDLNIQMEGSPQFVEVTKSSDTLTASGSVDLGVFFTDSYSENTFGSYTVSCTLTDSVNNLVDQISISNSVPGANYQYYKTTYYSEESISSGGYGLSYSIIDPDGNSVSQLLDTLYISN